MITTILKFLNVNYVYFILNKCYGCSVNFTAVGVGNLEFVIILSQLSRNIIFYNVRGQDIEYTKL